MAVRDVAVGQDGTVIISTESGSVWTRVRRAKPKVSPRQGEKEFKFARVGSLTRIVAVRANSAGAYAAIRNDVDIRVVEVEESTLSEDLIRQVPLGGVVDVLGGEEDESTTVGDSDEEGEEKVVKEKVSSEMPWEELFVDLPPPSESCDVALVTKGGHRVYLHKAMLACRSVAFRDFLKKKSPAFNVRDVDGIMDVNLENIGVVAAAQLVHYLYADKLLDLPETKDDHKGKRLQMIAELRTLAEKFHLKQLSDALPSSWYIVLYPEPTLRKHLRNLHKLSPKLTSPDTILCLKDREVACHSFILQARCPFFEAMLDTARMGGGWVASRRNEARAEGSSEVKIQLKHLSWNHMSLVLDHIYSDGEIELFDHVQKETSDEFLEYVIEVMAVSNELLLDRLKDICQSVLARFGTNSPEYL